MGLFDYLRRSTVAGSAHPRDPVLAALWGGAQTAVGKRIDADAAMAQATVYACIRAKALPLGWLPLAVYKSTGDGREIDRTHRLSTLLRRPNRWQTAVEFRAMMTGHLELRGIAYAEIVPGPGKGIAALVPLHPDRVRPFWAPDGSIAYAHHRAGGERRILLQDEMFVLRGFGLAPGDDIEPFKPLSPIALHRETVGRVLAMEEHGARLFANSAQPKGGIKVPAGLSDQAVENLRDAWNRRHKGVENAGNVAVFDHGMDWVQIGMNAEDAQYIESRKLDDYAICRIFGVPPHKVALLDRATFSNIEHQGLEFVTDSLSPLAELWQQSIERDLFTDRDRAENYMKFNFGALVRGDIRTRFEAYARAIQSGIFSPNDARELEDRPPVEGGDTYLAPVNMAPIEMLGQIFGGKTKGTTDEQG